MEDKDLFIPHSQYHSCWCPGDTRSQSINSHGTDLVILVYSSFNTMVNSLWPSDVIWRHGSGSTLAQIMACYLMAPSHYVNQCWPVKLVRSCGIHLRAISQEVLKILILWYGFQDNQFKITVTCPRGQWVKLYSYGWVICIIIDSGTDLSLVQHWRTIKNVLSCLQNVSHFDSAFTGQWLKITFIWH